MNTHLPAPKHTSSHFIYCSTAQVAEFCQLPDFSDKDKKVSFLAAFTFMKPVDLCSRHLPTGDYYTAENHYCNITYIVLGLRL